MYGLTLLVSMFTRSHNGRSSPEFLGLSVLTNIAIHQDNLRELDVFVLVRDAYTTS